jgi:hypothetical protein
MGAICGGERTEEEEQAEEELAEKAIYFLCEPKYTHHANGAYNIEGMRAEVERREALPPLALTVQDINGKNDWGVVSVAHWDRIGATLSKGLDHYYCVTRVLFGGIELTLTERWEETPGISWKDGVSAPS